MHCHSLFCSIFMFTSLPMTFRVNVVVIVFIFKYCVSIFSAVCISCVHCLAMFTPSSGHGRDSAHLAFNLFHSARLSSDVNIFWNEIRSFCFHSIALSAFHDLTWFAPAPCQFWHYFLLCGSFMYVHLGVHTICCLWFISVATFWAHVSDLLHFMKHIVGSSMFGTQN